MVLRKKSELDIWLSFPNFEIITGKNKLAFGTLVIVILQYRRHPCGYIFQSNVLLLELNYSNGKDD